MKIRRPNPAGEPPLDPAGALPGPVSVGEGRVRVDLRVLPLGPDLLVLITGGAVHLGAVAACDGSRSRAHAGPAGQILVLPGHKEGPLAAEAVETLVRATGRACAAVVGIHQDDATSDEIHAIVANVRQGLARLVAALGGEERT